MTIRVNTATSGAMFITKKLQKDFKKVTRSLMQLRQFSSWTINQGYRNGMTASWVVANKLTPEAPLGIGQTTPVEDVSSYSGECTIREYKKGSMFDKLITDVSEIDVKAMVEDNLAVAFAESVEIYGAAPAFRSTNLKVSPVGGNSGTEVDFHDTVTDGTFAGVNNAALTLDHVLEINLKMDELNIPDRDGKRYAVGTPFAFRNIKKELINVSQYSSEGFSNIVNGKLFEFDNTVFVKQTAVPRQGWASGKSDEVFFFGADSIVEVLVEAENIIANVPADFNNEHGLAYRALLGHSLIRKDRVVHWTSAS